MPKNGHISCQSERKSTFQHLPNCSSFRKLPSCHLSKRYRTGSIAAPSVAGFQKTPNWSLCIGTGLVRSKQWHFGHETHGVRNLSTAFARDTGLEVCSLQCLWKETMFLQSPAFAQLFKQSISFIIIHDGQSFLLRSTTSSDMC